MTELALPTPRIFQLAYVTCDLDRACTLVGEVMGLGEFTAVPAAAIDLQIPAGATASLKVAVAWAGPWQIELIEPVAGAVGLYHDAMPVSDRAAFHHIGAIVPGSREDWDRFRATIPDDSIALEGGRSQMRFVYVDERATAGHYVEYVWMSDAFIDASPAWQPVKGLAAVAAPPPAPLKE